MFGSYLKTGLRSLLKNKVFTFLNLFGLSLALGCCILEYCFIRLYNNMDSFHVNGERTFMVATRMNRDGSEKLFGDSPLALGPTLQTDFPQVKRIARMQSWSGKIQDGDRLFQETFFLVDPDFLKVFSFPLYAGNSQALSEKSGVVISHDLAIKLFNTTDCLDRTIEVQFSSSVQEVKRFSFTVKGVAEPFPNSASFRFNILANWDIFRDLNGNQADDWKQPVAATFVELTAPEDLTLLQNQQAKYEKLQREANPDWPVLSFHFEPLRTLSLNSPAITGDIATGIGTASRITMVVLAILLLFLGLFNFINMSLAKSAPRLREIGFRKVTGATRVQLIFQFLTENALFSLLALLAGLMMAHYFLLPGFSDIGPMKLELTATDIWLWVFLAVTWLVATLGGGAYPALYISKFNPIGIFKGETK